MDCTTFETKTQSGGSKTNENLIPEKVYYPPAYSSPELVALLPTSAGEILTDCERVAPFFTPQGWHSSAWGKKDKADEWRKKLDEARKASATRPKEKQP